MNGYGLIEWAGCGQVHCDGERPVVVGVEDLESVVPDPLDAGLSPASECCSLHVIEQQIRIQGEIDLNVRLKHVAVKAEGISRDRAEGAKRPWCAGVVAPLAGVCTKFLFGNGLVCPANN